MDILFINGSPNKNGNTAKMAAKLLEGRTYQTLDLVEYKLYSYGQNFEFLYQGAAPEDWMFQKAEYTMSRFARMYGMDYVGMATNSNEAEKLAKEI